MIKKDIAEIKALEALTWLSKNQELLRDFMEQSGGTVTDIFERAKDSQFLMFVVEYCLTTDEIALECAKALKIKPEELKEILIMLPGSETYSWT